MVQNPPKFDPKWRKSVPGGTPKRRQEEKMKKRVVVPNSFVVFQGFLRKMGPKMEAKFEQKSIKKLLKKLTFFV